MAKKSLIAKAKGQGKYSVRRYNRCPLCGRPRGYYRKFDLCRICLRILALRGEITGVINQAGKSKERVMGLTDPIADMLTRVRNANRIHTKSVDVLLSHINLNVAKVLKKSGYIGSYDIKKEAKGHDVLRIYLRYPNTKKTVITDIKRVSKPSRRVYVNVKEIPKVLNGYGIAILSTSRGIVTDKEARELNVGGEVLCYVW